MKFDKSSLRNAREIMEAKVIKAMQYAGEEFVKNAREMTKAQGGFGDVTGNLRSSIGYFIVKDGKVIDQMVYLSEDGTDRQTGLSIGLKFIKSFFKKKTGFQLVGFAGMDYASHVESRGLNVISVQKEVALVNLNNYLKATTTSKN